jgi:hypothetical protein
VGHEPEEAGRVQVSFKMGKKEPFDRSTSGRLKLTREEDRRAYLPATVEIELGGLPFQFRARYDGRKKSEELGKSGVVLSL